MNIKIEWRSWVRARVRSDWRLDKRDKGQGVWVLIEVG